MPVVTAKIVGTAAVAAVGYLWWRRRLRKVGPVAPLPRPPTPQPGEPPIPPPTEEEADEIFQIARASGDIGELSSIADMFFAQGFDQYGRQIETAINRYQYGQQCLRVTCIDTQIRPGLDWLASNRFTGLFGQLSAHLSIVVANAQASGEV